MKMRIAILWTALSLSGCIKAQTNLTTPVKILPTPNHVTEGKLNIQKADNSGPYLSIDAGGVKQFGPSSSYSLLSSGSLTLFNGTVTTMSIDNPFGGRMRMYDTGGVLQNSIDTSNVALVNLTLASLNGSGDRCVQANSGGTLSATLPCFTGGSSWSSYTPSVFSSSGTVTTTTLLAHYFQMGKTVFIQVRWSGTISMASTSMTFSLPVAPQTSFSQMLPVQYADNTSGIVVAQAIGLGGVSLGVSIPGTIPAATGILWQFGGVYEAN